MKNSTFTQGPWKLEPILLTQLGGKGVYCRTVRQSGGFRIADVFAPSEGVTGTTEKRNEDLANARLIAAAPEMHAALKAVLPILESCAKERHRMSGETRLGEHRDELRAILAKVEGEK